MQHFYLWHFNKAKRISFIIILCSCLALLLFITNIGISSIFPKVEKTALTKGNIKDTKIALTFNISWGEEKVFDILNELTKQNERATFFVSGEWAEKHPHILEDIIKDGHELGMLGYRYKSYLDIDIHQVRQDLLYAKEVFGKLGFPDIEYVRTPNGHINKEIIDLTKELGFTAVHWSVNPNDWENPGVSKINDYVIEHTANGDVILLHASDAAKQTEESLQTIIPALKAKGFKLSTISELLMNMTAEEKLIQ